MQSILNKMKENIEDRIVEFFWIALKAVVITAIILLLLRMFPIIIEHDGSVTVHQGHQSWRINSY